MRRSPRAKKPARRRAADLAPYVRWALLVVALVTALLVISRLAMIVPPSVDELAISATARTAAFLVRGVGISCELVGGDRLRLTNHVLRIDAACTALAWLGMYAAAVLLMPIELRWRCRGLLVGVPALTAYNLVRLVAVSAVSQWRPEAFSIVHDAVMQIGFVVATVATWALWMWHSRDHWLTGWEV